MRHIIGVLVLVCGTLTGASQPALSQSIFSKLGSKAKQVANDKANQAMDSAVSKAAQAVVCAITDVACINKAKANGKPIKVTDASGKPVSSADSAAVQFTAMNTITLKDLDGSMASAGNSLLSMVQMLAMSLGVAVASAVLAGYTGIFGNATPLATLHAFEATFVSMGLITLASALIFWNLPPEARAVQPAQPEVSGQG